MSSYPPSDWLPSAESLIVPASARLSMRRAIASTEPVLLTGETGTGKSLVARVIHNASRRSGGPFLPVNCAALPENLLERELYGHVAGAFTDAGPGSAGYLEAASGGSLLLDEIGELAFSQQAKLLTTLENGLVRRLGSPKPIHTDVRIMSATNLDLLASVDGGTFRRDLYYRLSVVCIDLPPLRQRRDDLPALVSAVLNRIAGGADLALTEDVWTLFRSHAWPGNIRELETVLRYAIQFGCTSITPELLPDSLRAVPPRRSPARRSRELDREHLIAALHECSGNRTKAARLLGVSRTTLWTKLRILGMSEVQAGRETPSATLTNGSASYQLPSAGHHTGQSPAQLSGRRTRQSVVRVVRDFRDAIRVVRARPWGFLGRSALLGTAIGLAAAVFMLVDPFLLRPVPYPAADELVVINVQQSRSSLQLPASPLPSIGTWRKRVDWFVDLGAYRRAPVERFETTGGDVVVQTVQVTERFFDLFGVLPHPVHRADPSGDAIPLVLRDSIFRKVFPHTTLANVVERTFARPASGFVRVVGVLPREFVFPTIHATFPVDALVPVGDDDVRVTADGLIVGRPAPGTDLRSLERQLAASLPDPLSWNVTVTPLDGYLKAPARRVALGATGACALILVACVANLANMRLVSRAARTREFVTRRAVGATDGAILRLVCCELSVEVVAGTALGLFASSLAVAWLTIMMPAEYLLLGAPAVTARVAAFGTLVGLFIVATSQVPVFVATRQRTSSSSESGHTRRLRIGATAVQSTLAGLLLISASTLGLSWVALVRQDVGFDRQAVVLTTSYRPGRGALKLAGDIQETIARLQALPHVDSAGAAIGSMLDRLLFPASVSVRGRSVSAALKQVTPGYFRAAGSRVVAGRLFKTDVGLQSEMIVTEALARQLGLGGSAIGEIAGPWQAQIVGIVADERNRALDDGSMPTAFLPLRDPWGACVRHPCGQVSYVIRSPNGAEDLVSRAERVVSSVNRDAIVYEADSIGARLNGTVRDRSFAAIVLGGFAAASIITAVAGLVGLVAFTVRRRTREIAVRMAVGARSHHILVLVLAEAVGATAAGLGIAFLLGRVTARALEHLVFGIAATNGPLLGLAGIGMLFFASVIAALIPAWKALFVSPTKALRVE